MFLDLYLADMDGFEVMATLRTAKVTVPTIAITGRGMGSLETRAKGAGAACLLNKPIPAEDLLAVLGHTTGNP